MAFAETSPDAEETIHAKIMRLYKGFYRALRNLA
jgi:hypothetical protein